MDGHPEKRADSAAGGFSGRLPELPKRTVIGRNGVPFDVQGIDRFKALFREDGPAFFWFHGFPRCFLQEAGGKEEGAAVCVCSEQKSAAG